MALVHIFYDLDWNSLAFDTRGEIAKEALLYTYDVLAENGIGIVSVGGHLEDGKMLFSLTDGIGNIIIWDVGQTDYTYDENDIYIWQ